MQAITSATIQPTPVHPSSRLSQKTPHWVALPRVAAIAQGSRYRPPSTASTQATTSTAVLVCRWSVSGA